MYIHKRNILTNTSYTHIHTYTHTYIHTYIPTYIQAPEGFIEEAELRPGRQNYDQGGLVLSGSPQAELRPGRQNYNLGAHPQAGLRPMSSSS